MTKNIDSLTVEGFGEEWNAYKQTDLKDLKASFDQYFTIFPWDLLNKNSEGFDMGCGSGRWAKFIAPHVGKLNCIDPSEKALRVARLNLKEHNNCTFEQSIVDDCSLKNCSQDFGYSLGVLHHIPDTRKAMRACVSKLKPGAPFLVYLYYRFDNKSVLFTAIWRLSDISRKLICLLPFPLKLVITKIIAITVYYPLARFSLLLERIGFNVCDIPLSDYRHKSLYTMSTDALDRFGTRLEQRFTKNEIYEMMKDSGLKSITFSSTTPFWVAVGYKNQKTAR